MTTKSEFAAALMAEDRQRRIEPPAADEVLAYTRGNKQAAARVLRVDRKTLDRMIKRHHIETQSLRERARDASNGVS